MPNKTFVEDMLSVGSGLLGNLIDARHEFKAHAKQRAQNVMRDLDVVTRDEFDAAFAMLSKARSMQEDLAERLTIIESKLGISNSKSKVKTPRASLPSVKPRPAKRRGT